MTKSPLGALVVICTALAAHAQDVSSSDLAHRMMERRAVESVIWGMPAVNFELLAEAMARTGSRWNQIIYWSGLPDWKNQTLTPNPDTIYLIPFYNTKEAGPVVLEIPPAEGGTITGSIDNAWQGPLEDVGPAGADKGKGGKYLILPPGYKGPIPGGYIPLPSETYTGFALLRSNLKSGSDKDIARALAYGKTVRFYPLTQADHPPQTIFVDAINVIFDNTIPYDLRFFQLLDQIIQREPWQQRDKAMIDQLKSIGIEKGKTFNPDVKTQSVLNDAAREAHLWLGRGYDALFVSSYYPKSHWALPASKEVLEGLQTNFANPDSYPVDGRGLTYSFAFFSAKHLGTGQFYLMAIDDGNGAPLNGAGTYSLTIPANAPVNLYWSATIYDRSTHALIRNLSWSSRSSHTPGLKVNPDGSAEIYFAPKAPATGTSNWVPTDPNGDFEVLFRFYGPQKPLFDKTWRLPDIKRISGRSSGE